MDRHRPPALNLSASAPAHPIPSSSSHRQSQSPFRYVHFPQPDQTSSNPSQSSPQSRIPQYSSHSALTLNRQSSSKLSHRSPSCSSSTRKPLIELFKPWLPIILYAMTSLGFLVAIALYKTEVFARLDQLAGWLQSNPQYGHAILFLLIFITTIPPIPMYSTLIILSGYTFGPWTGAIISYFSALTGAITVFFVSRTLFRDSISGWLASTSTLKRVVRAIEKRPKLLFLIRLAPYPYNVMNCLLAAAPTLTFRTYALCTALSLFKVIVHTSLGASIHSFKDYHVIPENGSPKESSGSDILARTWTIIGIILCVAIFIYLSIIARRAVEELDNEYPGNEEETIAFLYPSRPAGDAEQGVEREMIESPFNSQQFRPS